MTTQSTAASTRISTASPTLPDVLAPRSMTSATSSTSTATIDASRRPLGVSVPSATTRNGPSSSNGRNLAVEHAHLAGLRSSSRGRARLPTALVGRADHLDRPCTTWTAVAISSVAASTGGRMPCLGELGDAVRRVRSGIVRGVDQLGAEQGQEQDAADRQHQRHRRGRDDQHPRAQREPLVPPGARAGQSRRLQSIALAAHGLEHVRAERGVELLAEVADVHLDEVGVAGVGVAPDVAQDLLLRAGLAARRA